MRYACKPQAQPVVSRALSDHVEVDAIFVSRRAGVARVGGAVVGVAENDQIDPAIVVDVAGFASDARPVQPRDGRGLRLESTGALIEIEYGSRFEQIGFAAIQDNEVDPRIIVEVRKNDIRVVGSACAGLNVRSLPSTAMTSNRPSLSTSAVSM